MRWKRPEVDLAELAKLRWIDKWAIKDLAARYQLSPITMGQYLRRLRKDGLNSIDLPQEFASEIKAEAKREHQLIQQTLKR